MQNLLSKVLDENKKILDDIFFDSNDVKRQRVLLADSEQALLVYVDGLVNSDILQRDIVPFLVQLNSADIFDESMALSNIPAIDSSIVKDFDSLVTDIVTGKAVIMFNGYDQALSVNVVKFEKRSITYPDVEKNVRGPHEGFVEALNTNVTILRRIIKNPRLKFKYIKVGTLTNQTALIVYIDGLANSENIQTVYNKLQDTDYDGVFDTGYLEQMLTDNPYTPFPHFIATERPDKTVSALQEGKIAIIIDGSPSALIMPTSFFSFFQAPDDYNSSWLVGSLNRLIRVSSFIIAIFSPALYIAIVSFHYYMVPLDLVIPLAESRMKVPFPPFLEVLILEFTIEMLREATIRLPTYIGTSIGIVGGLVIGQAVVDAGIVSNLVIIIVAATALASYLIPNYDMGLAVRYIRFIVMGFAAIFGMIGVVICALFIIAHLVVLESLGEPYFKPAMPFRTRDLKDTIIRPTLKNLRKRPSTGNPKDDIRGK
ncbi:MAG: GerA spore germination protein [Clostridia bacterium]|nr:GerA spore germination protein [Clostridia bacterium]